ncbi:hypothetical protein PFISCL1PPCAC_18771, partial [Pristionchus fissidentatus]
YMNNDDYSLLDVSKFTTAEDQKGFFQVAVGNAQLNFINTNAGAATAPMAVWVVRGDASNSDATVFDAASLNMTEARSLGVVTVMSASPFTLSSKTDGPMMMTSTLTGFDAINGEQVPCTTAFEQMNPDNYKDFRIGVRSPLISFFFDNLADSGFPNTMISLKSKKDLDVSFDFSSPSFVASPGYIGCKDGKTFRSSLYASTSFYKFSKLNSYYDVALTSQLNTDSNHPVTISDITNGKEYKWSGSVADNTNIKTLELQQTNNLEFSWTRNDNSIDQSFLIQLVPQLVSTTTLKPGPATSTARTSLPTTTAPYQNIDNYCNCGLVNGWFDGWNPTGIWVDVVILLDTSSSMGNSVEEAKSLVMSFVRLLSTDVNAEFYSRVGVIAVSDTIQEIYNLNMSSSDDLDTISKQDISKIDIAAGIEAAQKMFSNGMSSTSYRKNAKQIIYYLTNSEPGNNMKAADDFKNGGGIIIVNDYVQEGQFNSPGLKPIASDNFYFTDLSENYLTSLTLFCEVNCFCSSDSHSFNDDLLSPRTQANRGCFHPVNSGIPFDLARDTCNRENSSLVSIHDYAKEFFVSSVVATFGLKKKYWIAYQNNGSKWIWDDKSTDPFSDWDVNQPDTNGGNSLCAYATQTTGLNVKWTAANCAMPNLYVCESVPCRVGNKNC